MSAVSSGIFSLVNQLISISITFGSLSILGRLLTPEDFGLVGIILTVQTLFLPLLNLGLKPAFIKMPSVDEQVSNAFFTLNFSLGIIIAIFLIGSAPILMYIYEKPALLSLTLVFAISVVIQSLSQQHLAVLSRAKRFEKTMAVDICGLLCGNIIAIGSAFCGMGAWALVFRAIANGIGRYFSAKCFLLQRFHLVGLDTILQYKQSIRFSIEIVISRLAGDISTAIDKLIFGKYFSFDILGYYMQAFRLAKMPDANLRVSLTTPALAHFARMDQNKHKDGYLMMCSVVLFIAGVPCIILMTIGDWILPWFMGAQWIDAGIYLQFLGLWGLGKVFHGLSVIMHLNEMRMRSWTKTNLLALPLVLVAPLVFAWKGFGPIYFVTGLSVGYFIFWAVILLVSLFDFTGSAKALRQIAWSLLITLSGALSIGFAVKSALVYLRTSNQAGRTIDIVVVSLMIFSGVVLAQSVLNRRHAFGIYTFVRNRITTN
jgi:PST family polysaccharide transporter